ncbi:MAG: hypothetical protein K1060chlam1_01194 [Candidatus Anoxychlamydiales bacterium]|nr:hypothetical protein [Candidatus Anoxychlamydiales bacterium]
MNLEGIKDRIDTAFFNMSRSIEEMSFKSFKDSIGSAFKNISRSLNSNAQSLKGRVIEIKDAIKYGIGSVLLNLRFNVSKKVLEKSSQELKEEKVNELKNHAVELVGAIKGFENRNSRSHVSAETSSRYRNAVKAFEEYLMSLDERVTLKEYLEMIKGVEENKLQILFVSERFGEPFKTTDKFMSVSDFVDTLVSYYADKVETKGDKYGRDSYDKRIADVSKSLVKDLKRSFSNKGKDAFKALEKSKSKAIESLAETSRFKYLLQKDRKAVEKDLSEAISQKIQRTKKLSIAELFLNLPFDESVSAYTETSKAEKKEIADLFSALPVYKSIAAYTENSNSKAEAEKKEKEILEDVATMFEKAEAVDAEGNIEGIAIPDALDFNNLSEILGLDDLSLPPPPPPSPLTKDAVSAKDKGLASRIGSGISGLVTLFNSWGQE